MCELRPGEFRCHHAVRTAESERNIGAGGDGLIFLGELRGVYTSPTGFLAALFGLFACGFGFGVEIGLEK